VLLASGVLLVLGGLTTGAILLKNALERDGRFRIAGTENIQATGLSQVSRADLLPVFGEDIGKNIFFVRLGERRQQLEQIPWIEKATVMRLLPDQIRVAVVERTPIACVREGQQIELVDADGVLLTMSPSGMTQHHYSFPVVTGIDPRDAPASRKARMAVYQRLISDLDSSGQHLSQQISEIDLTDPEDARVLMPEQGGDILAHFGDEQFLTRYQRYKAHIGEWRQQYPRLEAVDLRYESQVVLQMAPGAGAAAAVSTTEGKAAADTEAPAAGAGSGAGSGKPSPARIAAGETKAKPPAKQEQKAHHVGKAAKPAEEREKQKHPAPRKAAAPGRQGVNDSAAANRAGEVSSR